MSNKVFSCHCCQHHEITKISGVNHVTCDDRKQFVTTEDKPTPPPTWCPLRAENREGR